MIAEALTILSGVASIALYVAMVRVDNRAIATYSIEQRHAYRNRGLTVTVEELAEVEQIGLQVAYKRCKQAYRRRGGLLQIPDRDTLYVVSKPSKSYRIQAVAADATRQLIEILQKQLSYVCDDCQTVVAQMITNLEE